MNTTCGFALKTGRKKAKMNLVNAALKLNISDRTLYKYERDEIKCKDPYVFMGAMELYGDATIGLTYLGEDPVFNELFGGEEPLLKKIVEKLKTALQATLDIFINNNNNQSFAY